MKTDQVSGVSLGKVALQQSEYLLALADDEISCLREQVALLKDKLVELGGVEEELEQVKKENEQLKRKNRDQGARIEILQGHLVTKESVIDDLHEKVAQGQNANDMLRKKLQSTTEQADGVIKRLELEIAQDKYIAKRLHST